MCIRTYEQKPRLGTRGGCPTSPRTTSALVVGRGNRTTSTMEAKPKYEDVKKSLRELQSRFDDGLINEFEYRGKSRQLLAQLEPSLPLGYYELRDASDCEVGYLALSISKSSGGFFGMITLTSGEWEVDYGCYSHEDPYETRTLLPVISSGSSSGSGPVSAMGWSFQDEQFLFGLEDAPYDGTLSLRVLRNSGTLAVSWAIESHDFDYDWSHRGEATAIPTAADEAREAFWMISDTRSVLTGEATREHFNKGPST